MSSFFSIGLAEWREACALGLNSAVAFIILACGTGKDNQTTAWSANAVQQYGGISWVRAKPAIEALEKAGLLQRAENFKQTKPRYQLRISDERIWLPKSIVMPLVRELPPIARIRQMQDVMLLRLFVELYFSQNLAADGGLSRSVYYRQYKKTEYCEHGKCVFYGFDEVALGTTWETEVTRVHRVAVSKAEQAAGKREGHVFFQRIGTLAAMGLLESSVCLFESASREGELLYPIDGPTSEEQSVKRAAEEVAEQLLPAWRCENNPHEYLIPVLRHQSKVEAFGVYRLRHRPHTARTGAWWAMLQERIALAKENFASLVG